jgi:hypothetical protein
VSQFDDAEFAARVHQVLARDAAAAEATKATKLEAARQVALQELEAEDREREQRERLAAAAAKHDAELEAARLLDIADLPANVFLPGTRDQRSLDEACLAHRIRLANPCAWYTAQYERSAAAAAMHSLRPIPVAQWLILREDPTVKRYVAARPVMPGDVAPIVPVAPSAAAMKSNSVAKALGF